MTWRLSEKLQAHAPGIYQAIQAASPEARKAVRQQQFQQQQQKQAATDPSTQHPGNITDYTKDGDNEWLLKASIFEQIKYWAEKESNEALDHWERARAAMNQEPKKHLN